MSREEPTFNNGFVTALAEEMGLKVCLRLKNPGRSIAPKGHDAEAHPEQIKAKERAGLRGRSVAVRCQKCARWFEAGTVNKACDLLAEHEATHPQPDPKEVLKALSPSFMSACSASAEVIRCTGEGEDIPLLPLTQEENDARIERRMEALRDRVLEFYRISPGRHTLPEVAHAIGMDRPDERGWYHDMARVFVAMMDAYHEAQRRGAKVQLHRAERVQLYDGEYRRRVRRRKYRHLYTPEGTITKLRLDYKKPTHGDQAKAETEISPKTRRKVRRSWQDVRFPAAVTPGRISAGERGARA